MNDDLSQGQEPNEPLGPIEFMPEVVESTNDHHYSDDLTGMPAASKEKEQTALSVVGLILALPFPILIIILWTTLNVIKQHNQVLGEGTMNAVFLYLLQFFVVPILSLTSIIIAFIVTLKPARLPKKIGYISLGVTGVGFIILGLFLNHT